MPRGGQNKVPTALAIVRGNPGKRPLNENEPEPIPMTTGNPPDWMDRLAKIHWHKLVKVLTWLTEADRDQLALYCQAYSRYRKLTKMIGDLDYSSPQFEGWEAKDIIAVLSGLPIRLEKAEASMRGLAAELGMNPVSRTRISAKKPDSVDTFEDWERGRKHG